jgi:cytochrome b6-f complex iron-sulfur subunit
MQRRRFLQVTAASLAGAGLSACTEGGNPIPREGQALGTVDEVRANIAEGQGAWYLADAQVYVVEVADADRDALAAAVPDEVHPGLAAGFVALSQRCPHLGCRVPFCEASGWFECPCHGSRFTPYGEVRRRPANTGMRYLPLAVEGDALRLLPSSVDGIDSDDPVVEVEPRGPHCV